VITSNNKLSSLYLFFEFLTTPKELAIEIAHPNNLLHLMLMNKPELHQLRFLEHVLRALFLVDPLRNLLGAET
jgi:hypothetical protein